MEGMEKQREILMDRLIPFLLILKLFLADLEIWRKTKLLRH
jgi:hypothetical protein